MARKKKKEKPLNLGVAATEYWTPPSRKSIIFFCCNHLIVACCIYFIALIMDRGNDQDALKLAMYVLGIMTLVLTYNYMWVSYHAGKFWRYFYRQMAIGLVIMFAVLIPAHIPNVPSIFTYLNKPVTIALHYDYKFKVPTDKEIDLLTRVIWGEARSEKSQYQSAIVHTIINRAEHPKKRYGATFSEILVRPYAYSCMNPDDPNYSKLLSLSKDSKEYKKIREVVLNTLLSRMAGGGDPTDGATHYHTKAVNPKWNQAATSMFTMGSHKFWVGVDENDPDRRK